MARKAKKFKGGVSRNAAKQSRGTTYGHLNLPKGVRVFKEEPRSRVDIDILPYEVTSPVHLDRDDEYEIAVPGELWYKKPYYLHRNIGTNKESVVCPSTIKKPCPICEYRAQLMKEGAAWDDEIVRGLKPSLRNLYAIIPRNSKTYPEEIHVWDISQFLFQDKLNEEIQENEQYESFPSLEDGYTLRIRFTEETLGNNKFAATSRIDFIERDNPYSDDILDEVPLLDEILVIPSYKALSAMFFGDLPIDEIDEEDEGEEDKGEEESSSVRKPSSSRPKPVSEQEEDEEETEIDDEKDEEPIPVKKSATQKPVTKKTVKKKGKKEVSAEECPHGHTFGEDADEFPECMECVLWEDCMDAS